MAHYAKVKNGIVETVIVAEAEFLKLLLMILQVNGFKHLIIHEEGYTMILQLESLAKIKQGSSKKLRNPGGNYNSEADAFYHPQPEADWTLNTTTYLWEAPEE